MKRFVWKKYFSEKKKLKIKISAVTLVNGSEAELVSVLRKNNLNIFRAIGNAM